MRSTMAEVHFTKYHSVDLNTSIDFHLTTTKADDPFEWYAALNLAGHLVAYVAMLALMLLIVFLIMKYFTDMDDQTTADQGTTATETSPLRPHKAIQFTYGTCDEDIESGNCDTSVSSSSSNSRFSEELYDGKVCVICYDEERNCFFVPCGHCATCYVCAKRIFNEENKVCPVCRRCIRRVRKLFAS